MKRPFGRKALAASAALLLFPLLLPAQNQTYLPPTGGRQLPGHSDDADPSTGNAQLTQSSSATSKSNTVEIVPPPPVMINGKPADRMTEEEERTFLQEKIRTISQPDGEVEIIHVAPGYPVTIRYSEPIADIAIGDKKLVSVQKHGKILLLNALLPNGDTPLQVFFSGSRMRPYHIFATDTYAKGDSSITVQPFIMDGTPQGYQPNMSRRDLRDFIHIIANYDALKQEGSLDSRNIRRDDVFRENPATGFTIYYLYRIHGAAAFTFAYKNISRNRVRFDESRVRLAIGNSLFIPDYVSFHDVQLDPGGTTTGLVILFNPTFDVRQPLEIVWK
ncbi:MAG: hypothetical protein PW734_11340 [Verrucomicrobium sp.]|nr:hypothetical protein [Verrucomicrobium sp.]